jgi:hypothetical protein
VDIAPEIPAETEGDTMTTELTTEIRFCDATVYAGTYYQPAEGCDNEADEDSDYCADHAHADEYDGGPDFDQEYDDAWGDAAADAWENDYYGE